MFPRAWANPRQRDTLDFGWEPDIRSSFVVKQIDGQIDVLVGASDAFGHASDLAGIQAGAECSSWPFAFQRCIGLEHAYVVAAFVAWRKDSFGRVAFHTSCC